MQESRNYLLFTDNYYRSKIELLILGGCIIERLTERAFLAQVPVSIKTTDLRFSSFTEPKVLDSETIEVAKKWREWNQDFLPGYMG